MGDGCTDYWSQGQDALLSTLAFQLCDWDGPLVSPPLSFSLLTSTLLSSSLLFACPVPSLLFPCLPPLSNFCLTSAYSVVQVRLKIGAILCSSLPIVCIRGICLLAQGTYFLKIRLLHMCNEIKDTFSPAVLGWICEKMDP